MFLARSDWLLNRRIREYAVQLFTDSPPVPPCERRQTRVSYEQNGYPVCRRNEQRISQIIKQAVPEIHEKGDEIRF